MKKSIKAGKERKPRKPRRAREENITYSDGEYTPEANPTSNSRPRY
jgi:hypothetical protein